MVGPANRRQQGKASEAVRGAVGAKDARIVRLCCQSSSSEATASEEDF